MRAAVSIGLMGSTDGTTLRALAPRIERLGFDALWLNDVPGGDSLAGLRGVAGVTGRLRLATGVIPLDRRPAATLDLTGLPADRTAIGIGSGRAPHPLGLVEAAVASLRTVTDAAIVVGALGRRGREPVEQHPVGLLGREPPHPRAEGTDDDRGIRHRSR